ncbi:type VII secretion protein EsaA [Oceanobacillus longus]|uniref:Type VII secretion protein EsaA n=1 Tax=Oceanobacillus longus TaxID=930120 RepID=A0ABV8GXF2_9BACI
MKEEHKSSIGLIVKVLVILLLPLLLFRYVDSQPTAVVSDANDEQIRSVAIVNEDIGLDTGTESITLGQEIPALLNEQIEYNWTVVNRSAAEQGFSNQSYDAIIYIPSGFSQNIMTFKEDTPTKASINYVIQPNLEAKERQRIHREMANAKNRINQEMSTIYWSYVSQEVNNIQEQFDAIVEKEIAFQDAMYAFYTPSSQTLSHEIDQHKRNLENILDQTNQVNDFSSDSTNAAEEAETQMSQFTDALEAYKDSQQEQQRLLELAQVENQETIQTGVESYNQALEESIASIEEKFRQQSVVFNNNQKKIVGSFNNMQANISRGNGILQEWRLYSDLRKEKQEQAFLEVNTAIVELYNDRLSDEKMVNANSRLEEGIVAFKNAPITASLIEPIAPEIGEIEGVNLASLQEHLEGLGNAITMVKELIPSGRNSNPDPVESEPVEEPMVSEEKTESEESLGEEVSEPVDDSNPEPEPELDPSIDWSMIDGTYQALSDELQGLQEQYEDPNQIISAWKDYATDWNTSFELINEEIMKATDVIVNNIEAKQVIILQLLKDKGEDSAKSSLEEQFQGIGDRANKTLLSLVQYSEDLSVYQAFLEQDKMTDEQLIKSVLDDEFIQQSMEEIFKVNTYYTDQLSAVLGNSSDQLSTASSSNGQVSFEDLVNETNQLFENYNNQIQEEQTNTISLLENMELQTDEITKQLQTANAETFEWEESPAVEYLDGQMIFDIQQGTSSNLEQLSELTASLEENQGNITSSTEELQEQVGMVQQQSDELNNNWSVNVASTQLIRDDVYDILGNTVVDGQENPIAYNHLANPVNVEGKVNGQVLTETEDRMPPVMMFVIILISGLLIGFLSHYYSSASYLVQGGLFLLLNLAVGLIISIYGLNIYSLDNAQAVQWTIFTILLLVACSNIVRGGLFVGPFIGWIASIAMIVFFISPLINIVVPEFSFNNPITNVYMSLQYGTEGSPYWTMAVLLLITLLVSAFIYTLQVLRNRPGVEQNEEKAS